MADYRDVNRANWDERVPAHAASPDYAVERFSEDPAFLSGVVTFDLPRLGDVSGLDGVPVPASAGQSVGPEGGTGGNASPVEPSLGADEPGTT